jgi:hypothetical protein
VVAQVGAERRAGGLKRARRAGDEGAMTRVTGFSVAGGAAGRFTKPFEPAKPAGPFSVFFKKIENGFLVYGSVSQFIVT